MSALAPLANEFPANGKFNALAQPVAPYALRCGRAARFTTNKMAVLESEAYQVHNTLRHSSVRKEPPMATQDIYHEDLAQIHIEGYGFHWEGATDAVLGMLNDHEIHSGLVVDLGCGGGQWMARLVREGYDVCGVDASPSMIRAARKLVPQAGFLTGSMADVKLPHCDAVTSLGEPINYLDGKQSIQRTFRHVYSALREGGIFVFDAMYPAVSKLEPRTATQVGDSWACIAVIEEDGPRNSVVRRITSFRKVGRHYRRSEETHRLKVYAKQETLQWLRDAGFRVRTRSSYGDYQLRERRTVFVARK